MSIEPENLPVSPDETLDRFIPVASPSQSVVRGWIRDVFFVVGTAIMIVIFLYQPVKVEGTSMLPS
jgi:signal peptidase I